MGVVGAEQKRMEQQARKLKPKLLTPRHRVQGRQLRKAMSPHPTRRLGEARYAQTFQ